MGRKGVGMGPGLLCTEQEQRADPTTKSNVGTLTGSWLKAKPRDNWDFLTWIRYQVVL